MPRYAALVLALLAFGSSLVWGASDFAAGLFTKRYPAMAVVGWSQGLAWPLLSLLVWWHGDAAGWSGWPWWSVAAGVVGPSALICFYTALATGTMGVVAPISGLGVVVPVVVGVASGEQPSSWAWVGILVAVVGVTLASGPELSGGTSARPVVLAGLAALGFGLALVCLERGGQHSALMTLWGMRSTSLVLLLAIAAAAPSTGGVARRDLPWLALVGSGDVAANGLFSVAASSGDLSTASVLGSLYPVVTILLAFVVLRERLAAVQWVGVVLSLGGAVLLSV